MSDQGLVLGCRVRIKGLISTPQHNDKEGLLMRFIEEKQRWLSLFPICINFCHTLSEVERTGRPIRAAGRQDRKPVAHQRAGGAYKGVHILVHISTVPANCNPEWSWIQMWVHFDSGVLLDCPACGCYDLLPRRPLFGRISTTSARCTYGAFARSTACCVLQLCQTICSKFTQHPVPHAACYS